MRLVGCGESYVYLPWKEFLVGNRPLLCGLPAIPESCFQAARDAVSGGDMHGVRFSHVTSIAGRTP